MSVALGLLQNMAFFKYDQFDLSLISTHTKHSGSSSSSFQVSDLLSRFRLDIRYNI